MAKNSVLSCHCGCTAQLYPHTKNQFRAPDYFWVIQRFHQLRLHSGTPQNDSLVTYILGRGILQWFHFHSFCFRYNECRANLNQKRDHTGMIPSVLSHQILKQEIEYHFWGVGVVYYLMFSKIPIFTCFYDYYCLCE